MKNVVKLTVILSFLLSFNTCDNKDTVGKFSLSINISDRIKSATSDDIEKPYAVIISIEDKNGNVKYDTKELVLYKMNGEYLTESIRLVCDKYMLTKFLVVNKDNDVLYASPLEGSDNANYVDDPLPVEFNVVEDKIINVTIQVTSIDMSDNPESFGYASFGFEVINIDNGLMLSYPFNGNAEEETGSGYDGVVHGAKLCEDRFGNPNNAYVFDGNDDYIEVSNFGDIISTEEISVSIWLKSKESKFQFQLMLCPDENRFGVSVDYNHNSINHTFWDFGWEGGAGNASGRLYDKSEAFSTEWHHYVFISSISKSTMKIYKDGVLLAEETDPKPLLENLGKTLRIGSGDNMAYYNGKIDDIKMYNYVLTEQEILELYHEGEGLVAYYPFNGNAEDESGNVNHGEVNGAELTTDRNGISNSAYRFDGLDDYIEVSDFGNVVPTEEISVSMWVKSTESRFQFQLMLCPDDNRFGVSVDYNHNNVNHSFWDFGWEGYSGNAPGRLYDNTETFNTDWHHYVFISSISQGVMSIYKDGILLIEETDPKSLQNSADKYLRIGSGDNKAYYKGVIDDIRIYNKVLTSEKINQLYQE